VNIIATRNIFAMGGRSSWRRQTFIHTPRSLGPDDAKNCLGLTLGHKLRQRWPVVVAVDLLVRCPSHSIVAEITFTTSHPALQLLDDRSRAGGDAVGAFAVDSLRSTPTRRPFRKTFGGG
jgi:hypothetical protein